MALSEVEGGGERLLSILAEVARVAPTSLPVLILGESGVGKELVAKYLHEASTRAPGAFVVNLTPASASH